MREILFNALSTDPVLASLGLVASAVYSGDVDTPAERPFLNLRWGENNPGQSRVTQNVVTIWVHDGQDQDYSRIDAIILRLRDLMVLLETSFTSKGAIVCAEWQGDSQDLVDDGHQTNTRNTTFNLVGSGR